MSQGKQAKTLTDKQVKVVLDHTAGLRHPERDRVMVLLSVKAGLRAIEIAGLTWAMVTDADGEIASDIRLTNASSKGRNGGRTIPIHRDLHVALFALSPDAPDRSEFDRPATLNLA